MKHRIKGLVAAVFSPMNSDGSINVDLIPKLTEHVIQSGVKGLYTCGSTGEGPLLSKTERMQISEAYIKSANNRIPVFVHVGNDSLPEAQDLAKHAQDIGADAIAAVGPCYFKAQNIDSLIAYAAEIASAAPETDFYYYHIPALSGNDFDMTEFLEKAPSHIPTLKGIKYTSTVVHDFQLCKEKYGDRFQIFFGCDEMLTSGLIAGAEGAIGSTYNFMAPLYIKIIDAFQKGDMQTARKLQNVSIEIIKICIKYGPLPAFKSILKIVGLDCGPTRLPLVKLTEEEFNSLKIELESLGLNQWL
jgi:N-acetylneuraminate lyase